MTTNDNESERLLDIKMVCSEEGPRGSMYLVPTFHDSCLSQLAMDSEQTYTTRLVSRVLHHFIRQVGILLPTSIVDRTGDA